MLCYFTCICDHIVFSVFRPSSRMQNYLIGSHVLWIGPTKIRKKHLMTPVALCSGVQRLLDARCQRGSWMPIENIFHSSRKISDDLLLVIHQNFSLFASVVTFHENWLFGCPLSAASCPVTTFFSTFFSIYLLFYKNWPLGWSQGGCPGPSHRPHRPLHATGIMTYHSFVNKTDNTWIVQ